MKQLVLSAGERGNCHQRSSKSEGGMDARRCPQHSQRRHPLHEHRHTLPPSLTLEMSLSHPRPVSLSLPFEKFDPLAAWPMMASTPVTARWARRVRCGGQAARAAGPARGPGWGRVRSGGQGGSWRQGDGGWIRAPPLPLRERERERERERVHGGGGRGGRWRRLLGSCCRPGTTPDPGPRRTRPRARSRRPSHLAPP